MNGGYIILNSTYIDELFSKVATKEQAFSINGLYNYLDSIFKLGKVIIANPENSSSSSISFVNITKFPGASRYGISAITGNIAASIFINSNDSCTAQYTTIGG